MRGITACLVPLALGASLTGAFADDTCELADGMARHVLPRSRADEYRVTLAPPDYANGAPIRQHFLFATIWARLLTAELSAQTRGACDVTITPTLFPDLRALVVGFRSDSDPTDGSDTLCARRLRKLLHDWTPNEAAIVKTAADHATRASALISTRNNYPGAIAVLRRTLMQIYDTNSVMHAIASVDAAAYRTIVAGGFLDWLAKQRSGSYGLTRLAICPAETDPQAVAQRRASALPRSTPAPPGPIRIPIQELGGSLPDAFRTVVIVHDDGAAARPGSLSYCSGQHVVATRDDAGQIVSTPVAMQCQGSTVNQLEAWLVFFCEPRECKDRRAADILMNRIAADPDIIAQGKGSGKDSPKGPYLVTVTP